MSKDFEKILKELKLVRDEIKELRKAVSNNEINTDLVNQIISDLSAKQDITKIIADQEASLIKATTKKKTTSEKAAAPNAMNYFKNKYAEDSSFFDSVISPDELKEYFQKNSKKFKAVENDKKKVAGIIYTDFLKGNKKKLDMVKKIRDDEINGVKPKPVEKKKVTQKAESESESEESESKSEQESDSEQEQPESGSGSESGSESESEQD
jgi:hypothetical protein